MDSSRHRCCSNFLSFTLQRSGIKTKPGKTICRFLAKSAVGLVGLSFLLVALYRFVPVPFTPLMLIRGVEQLSAGKRLNWKHHWVSLDSISDNLVLAVICSEDQNFLKHSGFDFKAIEKSFDSAQKGDKPMRGASTISQQTAKNVFLWPSRSWIRKGLEVYFTVLVETVWSKERILEVYLNSIEMGDGIYGAEAAAQLYYKTSANSLSRTQAAAIAAVLPNPRKLKAHPPGPYVKGRIRWIVGQMNRLDRLEFKDLPSTRGQY